jgi:HemY protein
MKTGILILAALVLGAFSAHFLLEDSGYVLINMRGYAIEMSVPGLVLGLVLLYAAIRLLVRLWKAPRRLGRAAGRYREKRARDRLTQGLIAVAEGHAAKGERMLARSAGKSGAPLVSYLTAARAAQRLGSEERRDNWLKLAFERDPGAAPAILITQAEFQMERGQYDEALATLGRLEARAPGHARGIALTAQAYRHLQRWQDLESLLPKLARAKSVDPAELAALQEDSAIALMANAAVEKDAGRLEKIWQNLPKPLHARPALLTAHAKAAARCADHDKLEKRIRKTLKTAWIPGLVEVYGILETSNPRAHLSHAEAWLTRRGEDPILLMTNARLCIQNQLWGKARSYLETSLGMRPDPVGYRLYGQLLETMGEADGAAEAFRLGLETATAAARLPALEAPAAGRRS